jgi:hypothetical protein
VETRRSGLRRPAGENGSPHLWVRAREQACGGALAVGEGLFAIERERGAWQAARIQAPGEHAVRWADDDEKSANVRILKRRRTLGPRGRVRRRR